MERTTYGSAVGPDIQQRNFAETTAPYISEFVGTYLFVFTISVCSVAGSAAWNATAIAAMLMVLVYTFGPVSGAHLNPAVSVACGLAGKTPWAQAGAYCILQIAAGLLAGLTNFEVFHTAVGVAPVAPYTFGMAAAMEILYTTMLCFVVLSVATARGNNPDGDQNHFFGLAIGFVIIAGGYAAGGISGAIFNPAVALGLEVLGTREGGNPWALAYVAVELFGAVLAAILFRFCRREDATNTSDPSFEPPLYSRLLCELLGTFILAATVGINVATKSEATAWSAAAALMSMIYAVHDVSGGHLNPAVTTAVVLSGRGKCSLGRGLAYCAAQLVGGLLAGLLAFSVHSHGPYSSEEMTLAPQGTYSWIAVFAVELTYTAMLAYVVLTVATTRHAESPSKQNFQFGIAIASCITAGGFAVGSISGGVLNPAVSLCLATAGALVGTQPWKYCLVFSIFELTGGVTAAVLFCLTHRIEYRKPGALLD